MAVEKREQVFVSSTFRDLLDERRAVLQTLLQADCLPAGMELFPASDNEKFDLIKGVIDLSDYYLVIVGGRYGSIDGQEQLSYTEMEYDYAVSVKKPVIAFLHGAPGDIALAKSEGDPAMRDLLNKFRAKLEIKPVRYWHTADELAGQVALSLIQLRKTHPAVGWVRGDQAMTPEVRQEMAELRQRVAELTTQLTQEHQAMQPMIDAATLAAGAEDCSFVGTVSYWSPNEPEYNQYEHNLRSLGWEFDTTWDRIFGYLGPDMLNEASDSVLMSRLNGLGLDLLIEYEDQQPEETQIGTPSRVRVDVDSFNGVKVQLVGLDLIEVSEKKRGVNDTDTYWRLTPAGRTHLLGLRTQQASKAPEELTGPGATSTEPDQS
jgi:hypothetical protein